MRICPLSGSPYIYFAFLTLLSSCCLQVLLYFLSVTFFSEQRLHNKAFARATKGPGSSHRHSPKTDKIPRIGKGFCPEVEGLLYSMKPSHKPFYCKEQLGDEHMMFALIGSSIHTMPWMSSKHESLRLPQGTPMTH